MKRKISISTTVMLILLAIALTVTVTMKLSIRHFNNQLQLVGERQEMYFYIDDVDKVVREYYPNVTPEALRPGIAQGYVDGIGDRYADYFSPQQFEAEQLRLSSKANDVGVSFGLDAENHVVVSRVFTGSAADKAGVKAGDVVAALDGVSVEGKSLSELQNRIHSASKVLLTVRRGEGNHAYELSAFEYAVRTVQDRTIGTIGYIKITAFYENTPDQFKATVSALMEQGVKGLVFDLRNNVGGSPEAVQEMLSYVMPLGVYGTMTDTKGNVTKLSTKVSNRLNLPTVTLINGNTAGEAEFFAGVLQDGQLTTVMGQTSAGKAQYQRYFVLEQDYSALKLTVGSYGLMKSGSWQDKGIVPNETVMLPPEQEAIAQLLDPHEDAQVQAAVTKLEETAELPIGGATTPSNGIGNLTGTDTSADGTDTTADGTDGTTTTTAE
ncbi:MAG: PDZ domain-containing protein [Clostridia bacterium]|nr:PDZ domain-containing protein [Clostridia bacterium]